MIIMLSWRRLVARLDTMSKLSHLSLHRMSPIAYLPDFVYPRSDVTDYDRLSRTFDQIVGDFGHVDGLYVYLHPTSSSPPSIFSPLSFFSFHF